MHYSNYLKCNRKFAHEEPVSQPEQEAVQKVEEDAQSQSILAETVNKYLMQNNSDSVVIYDTVLSDADLNVGVTMTDAYKKIDSEQASEETSEPTEPEPVKEEFPEYNPNSPVAQMTSIIQNASPKDVAKANRAMTVLTNALEQYEVNPPTLLGEDEVDDIMTYMGELETKYFSDIPLAEELNMEFVWNIPKYIYDDMCTASNNNVPDVLNPMFPFYIYLTPCPGEAMATFIRKIMDLALDDPVTRSAMDQADVAWKARMDAADAEADDDGNLDTDDND